MGSTISIDTPLEQLGDIDKVDDVDIVRFIPTSTGPNTAGSFELFFVGSNYSLSDRDYGPDNDIDAIGFTPTGELLISTVHSFHEPLIGNFSNADLVYWDTSGIVPYWALYFDGSDVGLTTEDENVNGFWIDEDGQIFLTTSGLFDVNTITGDGADVFICDPSSLGSSTACTYSTPLYWNGSAHGNNVLASGSLVLDGFYMRSYLSPTCEEPLNCSFEDGLNDWTVINNPYPNNANWSATDIDAYAGRYSAMLYVTNTPTGSPRLISSIVLVEPDTSYGVAYSLNHIEGKVLLGSGVIWFFGDEGISVEEADPYFLLAQPGQPAWIRTHVSHFFCPPTGVIGFQRYFELGNVFAIPGAVLLDEVTIVSQQGACP
ncbi:MAG: hypothetical protein KJ063_24920 [Anaerolineae bacterium]|nr:hypothetical protein [Anaerolineae bacterium]